MDHFNHRTIYSNFVFRIKRNWLNLLLITLSLLPLFPRSVFSDDQRFPVANPVNRECNSVDIRNQISELRRLQGCTAVTGFIMIALIHQNESNKIGSQYSQYSFPDLREVTGFIIFFYVEHLKSIKDMFPNLVVIRGRTLFMDYALGVTSMKNLHEFSFYSLLAIQRGHVFIDSCPKLCNLDKVNWKRLTLTPGESRVYKHQNCKEESIPKCTGCESGYCWSQSVCQKFENDRVATLSHCLSYRQECELLSINGSEVNSYLKHLKCHPECLGGCYTTLNTGCVVCRNLTDHGACVSMCPDNKFIHDEHARCYSEYECTKLFKRVIFENKCLIRCPSGYEEKNETSICTPCPDNSCQTLCETGEFDVLITSLGEAETAGECKIIDGNVVLTIQAPIDEKQLLRSLGNIEVIKGYLKIYRCNHLTTLKFFENLKEIGGKSLSHGTFALEIIENKNLIELWDAKNLNIINGGISMHLNYKLCNRLAHDFLRQIEHNQILDKIHMNDQEVLCNPSKLNLFTQVKSQYSVELSWRKEQTAEQVEILYRHIPFGQKFHEFSELDSHVCERIYWTRLLYFHDELQSNSTHYILNIDDLQPNTQYAFLLKTFGLYEQGSQSLIQQLRTLPDLPLPLKLWSSEKTANSISLEWSGRNKTPEVITFYVIEYEEWPDDKKLFDQRNYCDYPIRTLALDREISIENENDYEECCRRKQEDADDEQFTEVDEMYKCNAKMGDRNCISDGNSNSSNHIHQIMLAKNETKFKAIGLRHFTIHTFKIYGCNKFGCGKSTLLSERTERLREADRVNITQACRFNRSEMYVISFDEPHQPNGVILSYNLHFRGPWNDTQLYRYEMKCITRLEHERHRNIIPVTIDENYPYNEIAVRTFSLAGSIISPYVKLTQCVKKSSSSSPPPSPTESPVRITSAQLWKINGYTIFIIIVIISLIITICAFIYKRRLNEDFLLAFCRQQTQQSNDDGERLVMNFLNQQQNENEDEIETELDDEIENHLANVSVAVDVHQHQQHHPHPHPDSNDEFVDYDDSGNLNDKIVTVDDVKVEQK